MGVATKDLQVVVGQHARITPRSAHAWEQTTPGLNLSPCMVRRWTLARSVPRPAREGEDADHSEQRPNSMSHAGSTRAPRGLEHEGREFGSVGIRGFRSMKRIWFADNLPGFGGIGVSWGESYGVSRNERTGRWTLHIRCVDEEGSGHCDRALRDNCRHRRSVLRARPRITTSSHRCSRSVMPGPRITDHTCAPAKPSFESAISSSSRECAAVAWAREPSGRGHGPIVASRALATDVTSACRASIWVKTSPTAVVPARRNLTWTKNGRFARRKTSSVVMPPSWPSLNA